MHQLLHSCIDMNWTSLVDGEVHVDQIDTLQVISKACARLMVQVTCSGGQLTKTQS